MPPKPAVIDAQTVGAILDVSRETLARLEVFTAMLKKWQNSINLVSRLSLDTVWQRHILDCGQIFRHINPNQFNQPSLMDIGTGAGLPGIILAILGSERAAFSRIMLVESNERKCAFLEAAIHAIGIKAEVVNHRIECLEPCLPDIITARALAPLHRLLEWTAPQHHQGLECFFMKGAKYRNELSCLTQYPTLKHAVIPSLTERDAGIIHLSGFTHPPM